MIDLHQLIKEWKEEKSYLVSVIIVIVSILLFTFNIPYREMIVLGGFLVFSIILLFKILK